MSRRTAALRDERGVMLVLFGVVLTLILFLGSAVVSIGSWYTHGRHLQTKVDASAFAGGGSWNFPCAADVDASIEEFAREYVGPHMQANGLPFIGSTTYNPQVGKVQQDQIHAVLNGPDWYDADTVPLPLEKTDPAGDPPGTICSAKILDVKATEQDSPLLWGWLPFWPDIKKKARIEIQQGSDFAGLLPIAVRVPKPVSAAAIWIDETTTNNPSTYGDILAAKYFTETCEPPLNQGCLPLIPTGLGHWTTEDTSLALDNWAEIVNLPATAGVVVALSFRPRCPGTSCFDLSYTDIDALCNQGVGRVKCFYTTESSGTQTTQSGLQFIRGYSPDPDPQPDLESAWLDTASGTNCYQGVYFSAPVTSSCNAVLHADVDSGAATAANTEVRYKLIAGTTSEQDDDPPAVGPLDCGNNFQPACELIPSGSARAAPVALDRQYARHSFAIQVRLRNVPLTAVLPLGPLPPQCALPVYGNQCRWFFTGAGRTTNDPSDALIFANPVQRAFMGDIDKSGPVKFLHMYADLTCDGFDPIAGDLGFVETGEAASIDPNPADPPCFKMEMGLQGALAKDQDEVPIQLNIGATSQSSVLDCDPDIPNLKEEIAQGCGLDRDPAYKANDFDPTPYCPTWNGINNFFNTPFQDWPPFECVATQTAATPNQIIEGLNERFFGDPNSPVCPVDDAAYKKGRNYWHDLNNQFMYDPPGIEPPQFDYFTFARPSRNHGNLLKKEDPRYVLLFMTPYNSFTGNGNEIYPVVLIGSFYISGYGRILGNGTVINEDPCSDGSGLAVGAGNTPPADMDTSTAGAVAWGHFISRVDLGGGGSTGAPCDPGVDFTPCVPVLVE